MPQAEVKMPFKGLIPYAEEDAEFFFGREHEQNIFTAHLIGERLTLLHGASGVGKSSVLRAGVEHQLRLLAKENIRILGKPKHVVVVFNEWRESDPVQGLLQRVQKAVTATMNGHHVSPVAPTLPLAQALFEWANRASGQLLIILDQFEEYFLYHPNEDGPGTFANEFPAAVNDPALPVNFLVSFRADAMSKLDFFKVRIPDLFRNRLEIKHLSQTEGEAAIRKPLDHYNAQIKKNGSLLPAVGIETNLVNEVLRQVKVGEKYIGDAGLGGLEKQSSPDQKNWEIETPYLQLVMTRLWEEEELLNPGKSKDDSYELRLDTLERLGGAERIVRTHLESIMGGLSRRERALGAGIFKHLVTPSGTKIAQTVTDLARYGKLSPKQEEQLGNMMIALSRGDKRILRDVPPPARQKDSACYEVFHDRLAEAILEWQRKYFERRRLLRLGLVTVGLAVLVAFMLGLTIFAFTQRATAQGATREAVMARNEAEKQRTIAEKQTLNALEEKLRADKEAETARSNEQKAREAQSDAERSAGIARQEKARADQQTQIAKSNALSAQNEAIRARQATEEAGRQASIAKSERDRANTQAQAAKKAEAEAIEQKEIAEAQRRKTTKALDIVKEIDSSNAYYKAVMRGHEKSVTYAALSENGQTLLTYGEDEAVRVWSVNKGEYEEDEPPLSFGGVTVAAAAFSPDSRFVVTTDSLSEVDSAGTEANSAPTFTMWDLSNGVPQQVDQFSPNGKGRATSIQFSPDGTKVLATVYRLGVIVWQWDPKTKKISGERLITNDGLKAAFSPNGKYIVTAIRNDVEVWSADGEFKHNSVVGNWTSSMAVSSDGDYFAIVHNSDDESGVTVWNLKDGSKTREFTTKSLITDVNFSVDGTRIVTASADKIARIWDIRDGSSIELRGHTGGVNTAAFELSGRYIITSSDDKTARVWDLGSNSEISSGIVELVPKGPGRGALSTLFDFDIGLQHDQETFNDNDDIHWLIQNTERAMIPFGSARIINLGPIKFDSLTAAKLQGLNYSPLPLNGNDDESNQLVKDNVFAVITSAGNYAKVQIIQYGETLKIRWVTYLNDRILAQESFDVLVKFRDDLVAADPAVKSVATSKLQRIVFALEKDQEVNRLLKAAAVSSTDSDGTKLRIALMQIRRNATLGNNYKLLDKINQAIVDYGGSRTIEYYDEGIQSLDALRLSCEQDEANKLAELIGLDVRRVNREENLDNVNVGTYRDAELSNLGRLILVEYTTDSDAQTKIAMHQSQGEVLRFKGSVSINYRVVNVLAFRKK